MSTEAYIEMVYRNLKGELSPMEFAALNEATAKDAELARLRIDIEDAWDVSGAEEVIVTKQETEDLLQKIVKKNKTATILSFKNLVAGIAALFALALGSVWLMQGQTKVYTEAGLVTLADNSTVDLRKGSRLEVNSFSDQGRNVTLRGEAFFDIAKDASRPFTITTSSTKVEVLGTSFLVKEAKESVFVDVEEGRVKFSGKRNDSESLILTKGMKAEYNEKKGLAKVEYENLSAWRDGVYQYQDQILSDVLKELSAIFSTRIDVENQQLLNCRISAILTADNLEDILNQLAGQLEMNANRSGQNWMLSGGKC